MAREGPTFGRALNLRMAGRSGMCLALSRWCRDMGDRPVPTSTSRAAYVAEIDFSVSRGSDFNIAWHLRNSRTSEGGVEQLTAHVATEVASLNYHASRTSEPQILFTPEFVLAGLQSGRTLTVAVVVEASRFTVCVDQKQVAQGSSARISAPTQSQLFVQDGTGTLRLTGARFYELP